MVSSASHPGKAMPSSKLVSPRFTGGRGMSAASTCPAAKVSPIQTRMAIVFLQNNPCLSFLYNVYPVSADFMHISPRLNCHYDNWLCLAGRFAKVNQYFLEQYLDQFG